MIELTMNKNEYTRNVKDKRPVILSITDLTDSKNIIFVHDLSSLSSCENNHANLLSKNERSLLMARNDRDTVVVNYPIDKDYLKYLKGIGIGPKEVYTVNSPNMIEKLDEELNNQQNTSKIKRHFGYSPFISNRKDLLIKDKISEKYLGNDESITRKYYDKSSFKEIVKSLGIKTADGEVFTPSHDKKNDEEVLKNMIEKYLPKTGEVILRDVLGEGGLNILIANEKNIDSVVKQVIDSNKKYLVECKLEIVNSPCYFGYIDDKGPTLAAVSNQILENMVTYSGSSMDFTAPVPKDAYRLFIKIGEKMQQDGFLGPFGVDFMETAKGEMLPCECNARVNGSMYPYELGRRLHEKNIDFNVIYSLKSKVNNFDNFSDMYNNSKINSILYKGDTDSGIVPFNVSNLNNGSIEFVVLANSQDEAKSLIRKYKNLVFDSSKLH